MKFRSISVILGMQTQQRTWVIGDVHGAAKGLTQCLDRAEVDLENDKVIQLGDVTDGYPDVYECMEILLGIKNLVALKGNHDEWFRQFCEKDFHPYHWNHGGPGTLESYLNHAGKPGMYSSTDAGYETALVSSDIPSAHRQFFMRQQLYHLDEHNRLFIHAGFKRGIPLEIQQRDDFYWDRTLWENAYEELLTDDGDDQIRFGAVKEFSTVHLGHTPTINWGSDQPLNAFNIWNLDTGAGHSGRLTIMDVDTKAYWQSDPMPELYERSFR